MGSFKDKWKRRLKALARWSETICMSRPQAGTFGEGQRALMVKLMSAAGMFFGILAILVVMIVWRGGWLVDRQEQQLWILGVCLILVMVGLLGVVRSLAFGGPVGRQQMKVTKDGIEMSSEASAEKITAAIKEVNNVDP